MNNKIREVEVNFSNKCGANCFCCSKPHGNMNEKLMKPKVFDALMEQLEDVEFEEIQTSGNGDAWMHPNFLEWVTRLKNKFPRARMCFYSSFAPMTKERTDAILDRDLFDAVYTRIDSLDPRIIRKASMINGDEVLANMAYFNTHKRRAEFNIGYSSPKQYYRKCRVILKKEPLHSPFEPWEVDSMYDELMPIRVKFFKEQEPGGLTKLDRIRQSLWAERSDPLTPVNLTHPCPKMETNILKNVCWVCPNGDLDMCGYDDQQGQFTYGNITTHSMLSLWNSPKRAEWLDKLATRRWRAYPCNSPQCCVMYADKDV